MIGLAVLFFTGLWWPGILVLVGISMVLQWVFSQEQLQPFQTQSAPAPRPAAPQPVTAPPAPASPVVFSQPAPAPAYHPVQLLPPTCSRCGGPVRAHEVIWTGSRSAACAYCGSALTLKKT